MAKAIDLTGQKFGRWTVVERGENTRTGAAAWRCKCDCGSESVVDGRELRKDKTKSCGCLAREMSAERQTKHGLEAHPLYSVWSNMIARCSNPKASQFADYGGRGIKVCERWQSVACFVEDMAEGHTPGLQIDRIDNDGDYEPENCRWVTPRENSNNRRSNCYVMHAGTPTTVADAARDLNMRPNTLWMRAHRKGLFVTKDGAPA